MTLEIEQLKKISLGPGEILVIHASPRASEADVNLALREMWKLVPELQGRVIITAFDSQSGITKK